MDKLKKELRSNLLGNPDVSIRKEALWQLPLVSYDVTFSQVKRLKMDVLMKMLLFAFQETDIHRAAALADMLFVEELFIRDLIEKMQRTGLIQLEKKGYKLTAKGYQYLEQGIFEEEMEPGEALVFYSAVHDQYLMRASAGSAEAGEKHPPYRYAVEGTVDTKRIHELLSEEKLNSEEENFQAIVTGIISCEEANTSYFPCIEFQLYDRQQDIFYARVWNGLTESWDDTLEKQIEEKEIVEWREALEQQEQGG